MVWLSNGIDPFRGPDGGELRFISSCKVLSNAGRISGLSWRDDLRDRGFLVFFEYFIVAGGEAYCGNPACGHAGLNGGGWGVGFCAWFLCVSDGGTVGFLEVVKELICGGKCGAGGGGSNVTNRL